MRNCSVVDSLFPPAFHLLFTLFAAGVIAQVAQVSICSANSFPIVINAYFIFLL